MPSREPPAQQERGRRRATGWEPEGRADELQGGTMVTEKRAENSQHYRLGFAVVGAGN